MPGSYWFKTDVNYSILSTRAKRNVRLKKKIFSSVLWKFREQQCDTSIIYNTFKTTKETNCCTFVVC